ncbi:hypothetical protein B0H10DRAFT_2225040 [Mycena sp. CBHHK59/15]|nr:hypothetical protein B0H10DRAFT_2225040 [Mycena sp. CBHHK59/15]
MILVGGDGKGATDPSAEPEEHRPEPSRDPAYTSSSTLITESAAHATDAAPIQIIVQHPSPELPSAFWPPSPSFFPHPHPHTRVSSSGPTPFFLPAAAPSTDGHYAYYDPRSPYSLALADRRALVRFWGAFMCSMCVLVLLWLMGLIQLG